MDRLRETMWAMNAVDHSTHPEVTTIDTTDEDGNPITTEITETVPVIELAHKTPDEMAVDYHFTTRKNTYLRLLQDPQYEELWAELLPRAVVNLCPRTAPAPQQALCNGRFRLQEQLPRNLATVLTPLLAKSVPTSAPALPVLREGAPILAAADGTVTVVNVLDS